MVTKDDRIYIRITTQIKEEFERVAEYRGLKPATLLHSLIVKTIHETRKESPEIFKNSTEKIMTLEEAKADDKKKQRKDKKMPPK